MGCSGLSWGPACAPPSVTCFHDCCPHLFAGDRGYKWYGDTSRLVPSCLEHSGRLGPLACQVEIFVTLSGIYRYLGRLSTVLSMVLIKLLQRRQVPGVVVLIVVLQCRYHCHRLSSSCRTRTRFRLVPQNVPVIRVVACSTECVRCRGR